MICKKNKGVGIPWIPGCSGHFWNGSRLACVHVTANISLGQNMIRGVQYLENLKDKHLNTILFWFKFNRIPNWV